MGDSHLPGPAQSWKVVSGPRSGSSLSYHLKRVSSSLPSLPPLPFGELVCWPIICETAGLVVCLILSEDMFIYSREGDGGEREEH